MNDPIYIVDYFDTIVTAVGTELSLTFLGYQYGHPVEINEHLVRISKSRSVTPDRFPLVCLLTDFAEERGEVFGIDSTVNLHLLIADLTRKSYTAEERMTNIFKPTLYPIYIELINQIARSKYFKESTPELIKHTKTDRLFWGKTGIMGNEGLIFTDLLDVIEITNLQLSVKSKKTC